MNEHTFSATHKEACTIDAIQIKSSEPELKIAIELNQCTCCWMWSITARP